MRLVVTFNLKRTELEDEAEFDALETITNLARTLRSLGHDVTPVDVSCSIPQLVTRLGRLRPDVIFNLAEGRRGRFREAFYPALFEQLGIGHTGSSAGVLSLCLDKVLTKCVVAAAGVAVPRGCVIRDVGELQRIGASFARLLIVKPNYEGSSKGITQASVVDGSDLCALEAVVTDVLERYPQGVLVEEYIDGMDVSVGWVEGLGVLPSIGYVYERCGEHRIMDLELKQGPPIRVEIPAPLDQHAAAQLTQAGAKAFSALEISGYGRADFRVTPEGRVVFLEMNPLPSLSQNDEELYAAAAAIGHTPRDMFSRIIAAASPARSAPVRMTA